ncbi:MAG: bifunctional oligoribonuclease/PAP phosphatase NrnA [Bacteroidales bacterium]|nr:bifunctional oligoribonuclease/PAP phosphatase NrnA [Bacteroidales bacterium]
MQRELFFSSLDTVIQSPKHITVLSHVNPDGDAIGSSLGFSQFLRKFGHEVEVMVPNDFPGFLAWMPGASEIHVYDKESELCDRILDRTDCLFLLDFNHISRSGLIQSKLKTLNTTKILIDHHRDTDIENFFCVLSDTEVSSTSELIAETVLHYGNDYLDDPIATNILVGIVTDTGSFSHSIFRPETFSLCARLLEKASSYNKIHQQVYDTFSEDRLRLLGYAISRKMEVLDEYATSIISLNKEELELFNYQVGDTEGIVNYPLSMEKIKMAVLVTERQGVIRFSFRSKGSFSVHELAQKHFNGGGHTNAAGGTLSCSMGQALEMLHNLLPEYKELLQQN